MGDELVGRGIVELAADASGLAVTLRQAEQMATSAFGKIQGAAADGLSTSTKIFGAIAAAAAAATAVMVKAADSAMEYGTEISRTSAKVGISVETLSALKYAAHQSDLEFGALTQGLNFLNRSIAGQADEFGKVSQGLKELGVNTRDASGALRSTDSVLAEVGDKIKALPDAATRTAVAMSVFGKSGAQLLPFLLAGSEATRQYTEDARTFGLVLSGETAAAADRLEEATKAQHAAMQGFWLSIGNAAIPAVTELREAFVGWARENSEWVRQDLAATFTALAGTVRVLGSFFGETASGPLSLFLKTLKVVVGTLWAMVEAAKTALDFMAGAINEIVGAAAMGIGKLVSFVNEDAGRSLMTFGESLVEQASGKLFDSLHEFAAAQKAFWLGEGQAAKESTAVVGAAMDDAVNQYKRMLAEKERHRKENEKAAKKAFDENQKQLDLENQHQITWMNAQAEASKKLLDFKRKEMSERRDMEKSLADAIKQIDDEAYTAAQEQRERVRDAIRTANESTLAGRIENLRAERLQVMVHYQTLIEQAKGNDEEIVRLKKALASRLRQIDRGIAEETASTWKTLVSQIAGYVQQAGQLLSAYSGLVQAKSDAELQRFKRTQDAETEALKKAWLARIEIAKKAGQDTVGLEDQLASALSELDAKHKAAMLAKQKKAFEQQKSMRRVEAIVNTAAAIMSALATSGNIWVGIVMAAMAAAMGAIQIATINAQKFSGQAHDGSLGLPASGTYAMEGGEFVADRKSGPTIAAFARAIETGSVSGPGAAAGGGGAGGSTVRVIVEAGEKLRSTSGLIREIVSGLNVYVQGEGGILVATKLVGDSNGA